MAPASFWSSHRPRLTDCWLFWLIGNPQSGKMCSWGFSPPVLNSFRLDFSWVYGHQAQDDFKALTKGFNLFFGYTHEQQEEEVRPVTRSSFIFPKFINNCLYSGKGDQAMSWGFLEVGFQRSIISLTWLTDWDHTGGDRPFRQSGVSKTPAGSRREGSEDTRGQWEGAWEGSGLLILLEIILISSHIALLRPSSNPSAVDDVWCVHQWPDPPIAPSSNSKVLLTHMAGLDQPGLPPPSHHAPVLPVPDCRQAPLLLFGKIL